MPGLLAASSPPETVHNTIVNPAKDVIIVPSGSKYWYDRTDEELKRISDLDDACGSTLDSAGEPKIYNKTASKTTKIDLTCTVIKSRGVPWSTCFKKPTHLLEVLATIDGMPKVIKVRDPRKV